MSKPATAKRLMIAAALALCCAALLVTPAARAGKGSFANCVALAAAHDLKAKREFQTGLSELIGTHSAALKPLADLAMRYQIAAAELRTLRLGFLARHDPARIEITDGASKFRNFSWRPEDDAGFAKTSDAYRQLKQTAASLKARSADHPDWPALRTLMRTEIAQDPIFRKLTGALAQQTRMLSIMIRQCRK